MSDRLNPASGQSASELQAQIEAEKAGTAFLVYRDGTGEQRLVKLTGSPPVIAVGRADEADISMPFDEEVSRLHVEFAFIAGDWLAIDDGVSTNGTFVNEKRIEGRRRLRDRDLVRVGETGILFRNPADEVAEETAIATETNVAAQLTDTQRRILIALCRPFRNGTQGVMPATNRAIAEEVSLSVDAIKGHLRVLFEKYGIGELPQNRKRITLAARAFKSGAVTPRDIRS